MVLRHRENRISARAAPGLTGPEEAKTASGRLPGPSNNHVESLFVALAVTAGLVLALLLILPTVDQAKAKALRISQVDRLKSIGLAIRIFEVDNEGQHLSSLNQLVTKGEVKADDLIDPLSGKPFTFLSSNVSLNNPGSVLVLGPLDKRGYANAVLADGGVRTVNSNQYFELFRSQPPKPKE